MGSKRAPKTSVNSVRSVREKTTQQLSSILSHIEGAFFFSQKNTDEQISQRCTETLSQPITQNLTPNRGLTPVPSPNGEGSDHRGYPSFAACVVMLLWSYLDTFIANHQHLRTITHHPSLANHQHLTTNTPHPSLAVTFCEICMPEAFCEFETVRKRGLLNL